MFFRNFLFRCLYRTGAFQYMMSVVCHVFFYWRVKELGSIGYRRHNEWMAVAVRSAGTEGWRGQSAAMTRQVQVK